MSRSDGGLRHVFPLSGQPTLQFRNTLLKYVAYIKKLYKIIIHLRKLKSQLLLGWCNVAEFNDRASQLLSQWVWLPAEWTPVYYCHHKTIKMFSVCVFLCETDAYCLWQDSAELSEEPSDLLRPVGSQHLLCTSGGTHLFPNALNAARGFTEQVQYPKFAASLVLTRCICSIFTSTL